MVRDSAFSSQFNFSKYLNSFFDSQSQQKDQLGSITRCCRHTVNRTQLMLQTHCNRTQLMLQTQCNRSQLVVSLTVTALLVYHRGLSTVLFGRLSSSSSKIFTHTNYWFLLVPVHSRPISEINSGTFFCLILKEKAPQICACIFVEFIRANLQFRQIFEASRLGGPLSPFSIGLTLPL